MVVRISDKTQNYSKVTKLLVKPKKIWVGKIVQIVINALYKRKTKNLCKLYTSLIHKLCMYE